MWLMGHLIDINDAEFSAYVAEPSGAPRGGVVVIHEIWGFLVDHIKDVADRIAGEGVILGDRPRPAERSGDSPEVGEELLRLRASPEPEEQSRVQPMMREKMAPLQAPEYGVWAVRALRHTVDRLAEQPDAGSIGGLGLLDALTRYGSSAERSRSRPAHRSLKLGLQDRPSAIQPT